jgi:hypothetical protein
VRLEPGTVAQRSGKTINLTPVYTTRSRPLAIDGEVTDFQTNEPP